MRHLNQLLPKRQRLKRGHHAALAYDAMPEFMANLRMRSAVAARALEFLVLTGARSGEVLGTTWDEIDLQKEVWTVPTVRATDMHGVAAKLEVALRVMVHQQGDGYDLFKATMEELRTTRCPNCGAPVCKR